MYVLRKRLSAVYCITLCTPAKCGLTTKSTTYSTKISVYWAHCPSFSRMSRFQSTAGQVSGGGGEVPLLLLSVAQFWRPKVDVIGIIRIIGLFRVFSVVRCTDRRQTFLSIITTSKCLADFVVIIIFCTVNTFIKRIIYSLNRVLENNDFPDSIRTF